METWDLFDIDRRPLNKIISRGTPMSFGEYHIKTNVWIVNDEKKVLLTLRDHTKSTYAHKWECVGGSLFVGEESIACAIRKIKEEVGLDIKADELIFLGTVTEESPVEKENIIVDVYLVFKNVEIEDIELGDGEKTIARWVTTEKLYSMFQDKTLANNVGKRMGAVYPVFEKKINGTE